MIDNYSTSNANILNKNINEKKELINSLTNKVLTKNSFSLLCQLSQPTEPTPVKIHLLNNIKKLKLSTKHYFTLIKILSKSSERQIQSMLKEELKLPVLDSLDNIVSNFPLQNNNIKDTESNHRFFNSSEVIREISLNHEMIILYEFFPLSSINKLNIFSEKQYGKRLIEIDRRYDKYSEQTLIEFVNITNNFLPENINKIELYSIYSFGDYIQLVFFCSLNSNIINMARRVELNQRKYIFERIQTQLENWIPKELHGLLFNNELKLLDYSFRLLSIYIYNTNKFASVIKEDKTHLRSLISSTPRSRANSFISRLEQDIQNHNNRINLLSQIGIDRELMLGLIGEELLIFVSEKLFKNKYESIFCNYIILNFFKRDSENTKLFEFILMHSKIQYILLIFMKIQQEMNELVIPEIKETHDLSLLISLKEIGYRLDSNIQSIKEKLTGYSNTRTVKVLEEGTYVFDEETWIYNALEKKGYHDNSLSISFGSLILSKWNLMDKLLSEKIVLINKFINKISDEINFIASLPQVNTMLINLGNDLITQIKKWENRIEQNDIEQWLLNFKRRDERIIALKILDKISFITESDLNALCQTLWNHIQAEIYKIPKIKFKFSNVGNITSGSSHIIKKFQENNGLDDTLFIDNSKLNELDKNNIIILLDDFIGSGKYFIRWYNENLKILNFRKIFYCSLAAFEEGVNKIENETFVTVIYGNLYEKTIKAIDGELFSKEEKKQIKKLINNYQERLPKSYHYGRDNCQLLVAFYYNIPNNSLAILWSEKNWKPLLKRK